MMIGIFENMIAQDDQVIIQLDPPQQVVEDQPSESIQESELQDGFDQPIPVQPLEREGADSNPDQAAGARD
jgi:hypothetical protein